MRRRLDVFILKYRNQSEESRQSALKEFEEIAVRFGKLAEESPSIPDEVYAQAEQELNEKFGESATPSNESKDNQW